jgi:hypothetical protein
MTYYKNNEPRDYSKMIYSLSVNSMDCEFVVKVDDVLAFKQEQGSGGSTTFKLNQFILNNGEHTVEVEMYPLHGKHVLGDAQVILTLHHLSGKRYARWRRTTGNGCSPIERTRFD